jgi:phosphoribosylglycinamide formyltransferase 1
MYSTELFSRFIQIAKDSPRVAILMSGGGSNARRILEQRETYKRWDIVTIVSDNPRSSASQIAEETGISSHVLEWNRDKYERRIDYFQELDRYLDSQKIQLLIYAGFMRITPGLIVNKYPGINMHPSDLTLIGTDGHPRFVGMNALPDMIASGIGYVASTAYIVEEGVDSGRPLLVTGHVPATVEDIAKSSEVHEQLKRTQEHVWFPRILAMLSEGNITFENIPIQGEHYSQDLL